MIKYAVFDFQSYHLNVHYQCQAAHNYQGVASNHKPIYYPHNLAHQVYHTPRNGNIFGRFSFPRFINLRKYRNSHQTTCNESNKLVHKFLKFTLSFSILIFQFYIIPFLNSPIYLFNLSSISPSNSFFTRIVFNRS